MQNVSVGEQVVAIGSPQGFENSTSTGVVSAKRDIDGLQYFQIDAAISPGSSGGPLMDYFGRVIGVNVATYLGAQNLNFAVPIDYIEYMVHRPDEKRRMAYIDFVEAEKTWMESYNELVDVEQQAFQICTTGLRPIEITYCRRTMEIMNFMSYILMTAWKPSVIMKP